MKRVSADSRIEQVLNRIRSASVALGRTRRSRARRACPSSAPSRARSSGTRRWSHGSALAAHGGMLGRCGAGSSPSAGGLGDDGDERVELLGREVAAVGLGITPRRKPSATTASGSTIALDEGRVLALEPDVGTGPSAVSPSVELWQPPQPGRRRARRRRRGGPGLVASARVAALVGSSRRLGSSGRGLSPPLCQPPRPALRRTRRSPLAVLLLLLARLPRRRQRGRRPGRPQPGRRHAPACWAGSFSHAQPDEGDHQGHRHEGDAERCRRRSLHAGAILSGQARGRAALALRSRRRVARVSRIDGDLDPARELHLLLDRGGDLVRDQRRALVVDRARVDDHADLAARRASRRRARRPDGASRSPRGRAAGRRTARASRRGRPGGRPRRRRRPGR